MSLVTKAYLRNGKASGEVNLAVHETTNPFRNETEEFLGILILDIPRGINLRLQPDGNWQLEFTDWNGTFHSHRLGKAKE